MFSLSKKTREFDALKASITCALSNRIVYTIDGIAMLLRVFLSFDHAKISSVVSVKKPVCLFSHAYTQTRCQSRRCKRIVRTKMSIDTLRSIVKKEREREREREREESRSKNYFLNAFASRSSNTSPRYTSRRIVPRVKHRHEKKNRAFPARFLHILFWHLSRNEIAQGKYIRGQ